MVVCNLRSGVPGKKKKTGTPDRRLRLCEDKLKVKIINSLPVTVRVSKTHMLKFPINKMQQRQSSWFIKAGLGSLIVLQNTM